MSIKNSSQILGNHLRRFYSFRSLCSKAPISQASEKWDLYAGLLLERLPVITKPLNALEQKVQNMLFQIDFENSYKCDHEIRHERETMQAELLKRGEIDLDIDADTTKQTAQDFEDACTDELAKFKLAPRSTEADNKNDMKSLYRKLDETLILFVNQTIGKDKVTILPQAKWSEGETLRQTAERALKEMEPEANLKIQFYGNAPCGFYKYKYPKDERKLSVGAKIFFFRAVLRKDNTNNIGKKVSYEWRCKEELHQILREPYYKAVTQFII